EYSITAHAKDIFHEDVDKDLLRWKIRNAKFVATVTGYNVRYLSELYLAGPHDYINTVRRVGGDADSLMVVGHNPGLELLVQMMTGDWERMPTAALACIHIPIDDWTDLDTTGGELAGIWRPKELD
ncbi:MAG: histidine phosphatase family protein, partial [Gemmatimonadota bacterium]